MKKNKFIFKLFFAFFMLFLVSCENDQDNLNSNVDEKILKSRTSDNQQLSDQSVSYLNKMIPDFELNDIDKSGEEFFIAKLKTKNNVAYLVTDINQEKIVAFIKFDLIKKSTEMYDYVSDEDAFTDNLYYYEKFEFQEFASEVNKRPRRFWGWQCYSEREVVGQCYRFCEYFFLGLNDGGSSYPCDDLPGNKPKMIEGVEKH